MRRLTVPAIALLLLAVTSGGLCEEVSGAVSGKWIPASNPYIITDDIWVETGQQLIVSEGVIIYAFANTCLTVNGLLQMSGSEEWPIIISTIEDGEHWNGIIIENSTSQNGYMYWVTIRDARAGVRIYGSTFEIMYCDFEIDWLLDDQSDAAIAAREGSALSFIQNTINMYARLSSAISAEIDYSSITATENRFNLFVGDPVGNNPGIGMKVNNSSGRVSRNYISAYSQGTTPDANLSPVVGVDLIHVENFTFSKNAVRVQTGSDEHSAGIRVSSTPRLVVDHNNICLYPMGEQSQQIGIEVRAESLVFLENSIVANPQNAYPENCYACLNWSPESSLIEVRYSDLWNVNYGDMEGIQFFSETNFDADPLWVNSRMEISEHSPCIDRGDPNYEIDPDGTRSDVGMHYYYQENNDTTFVAGQDFARPERFGIISIYPNPFNCRTRTVVSIAVPGKVKVAVYDLLGRQVATLADEYLQPGTHSYLWNGSSGSVTAPSGVYFLKLRSGEYSETRKVVFLR